MAPLRLKCRIARQGRKTLRQEWKLLAKNRPRLSSHEATSGYWCALASRAPSHVGCDMTACSDEITQIFAIQFERKSGRSIIASSHLYFLVSHGQACNAIFREEIRVWYRIYQAFRCRISIIALFLFWAHDNGVWPYLVSLDSTSAPCSTSTLAISSKPFLTAHQSGV